MDAVASDDDLVTARGIRVPSAAITWSATRSGGPGGQHANTSDTAVTIELDLERAELPTAVADRLREAHGEVVRAASADSRSQFRNRQIARQRLAELVDEAARPRRQRRPTKRTRGSHRRRLEEKRRRGEKKRNRSWRPGDER